jgi:hypothetical protein
VSKDGSAERLVALALPRYLAATVRDGGACVERSEANAVAAAEFIA